MNEHGPSSKRTANIGSMKARSTGIILLGFAFAVGWYALLGWALLWIWGIAKSVIQ